LSLLQFDNISDYCALTKVFFDLYVLGKYHYLKKLVKSYDSIKILIDGKILHAICTGLFSNSQFKNEKDEHQLFVDHSNISSVFFLLD
jgi:hypothetical protein